MLHSTETALLRVSNALLMHGDAGEGSMLVLLTLSAAFETLDHCDLGERFKQWVGISGSALEWFPFCLLDWSFSFNVPHQLKLSFVGFPKVLSWVRFCLYCMCFLFGR